MAMSLAFGAGVALFLAEIGAGGRRAPRISGRQTPRRSVRRVCAGCERQRALFRRHGVVKWERYHTLCMRCFRSHVHVLRAQA